MKEEELARNIPEINNRCGYQSITQQYLKKDVTMVRSHHRDIPIRGVFNNLST